MTLRTRILGSGFAVGEHCVKNSALAKICDTSDEWIRERTGIEQRYYVEDGVATSDLGVRAAVKALADAKVDKGDIDYVVFTTMTPDYYFPGCGSIAQAKLGLSNVPALDLRQQCSGFLYGLQACDALIRAGVARRVLFIGADVHSGFMPWSRRAFQVAIGRAEGPIPPDEWARNTEFRDRTTLFGDAGGALVLGPTEEDRGILGIVTHSDGSKAEALYVPGVGFASRPYVTEAHVKEYRYVPQMDGRTVFKMAVTKMPESVLEVCKKVGTSLDEVSLLIAHQANLRINEMVQRSLKLPDERVYNNIQKYGNTTSATIPIAYDECRKSGKIRPGDLVCFTGLGSGFHWGAALMRE